MSPTFDYATHVARNQGYISDETQQKIRSTRLLIAGCGIGSSSAVCAARMGFENFVLVDGDTVDSHNLNRQFYEFADIGRPKVEALKSAILRINPQAQVETFNGYLDAANTPQILSRADIVFDTVDFLDLPAILGLHGTARQLGKPVVTALSVGFGALVWYFPPDGPVSLVDILAPDLQAATTAAGGAQPLYADVFGVFIQRLAPYLDANVVEQVSKVLRLMKEGRPCPASQVAVGSFAIGAMAMTMIHDMLAGLQPTAAPKLVLHSFQQQKTTVVDLTAG